MTGRSVVGEVRMMHDLFLSFLPLYHSWVQGPTKNPTFFKKHKLNKKEVAASDT